MSCFRILSTLWRPPLLARDPRDIPCVHGMTRMKKAPLWEPSTFSPLFKVIQREQRLRWLVTKLQFSELSEDDHVGHHRIIILRMPHSVITVGDSEMLPAREPLDNWAWPDHQRWLEYSSYSHNTHQHHVSSIFCLGFYSSRVVFVTTTTMYIYIYIENKPQQKNFMRLENSGNNWLSWCKSIWEYICNILNIFYQQSSWSPTLYSRLWALSSMSSTNCFISSSCKDNDNDDSRDIDGDLGGVNGRSAGHEVDTVVNVPQQMLRAVISRQETCHHDHHRSGHCSYSMAVSSSSQTTL